MLKGIVNGAEKDIVRIPMKGKNLFDDSKAVRGYWIDNNGNSSAASYAAYQDDIPVGSASKFAVKYNGNKPYSYSMVFYDINSNFISRAHSSSPSTTYDAFAVPDDAVSARFQIACNTMEQMTIEKLQGFKIMLNLGSTALPYERYGYQEGWEVRDNQDRLIWGREDVFEGTDSIPFKACGGPISTLTVEGNGSQSSTPSPSNIVDFEGTAEAEDITGTATGTNTVTFPSDGRALQAWEIAGNGSQASTPSPSNIVPFDGTGERTENVMPFAAAQTVTLNGITFTSDGKGGYTVKGYSTAYTSVVFQLSDTFTIPISVGNGGNGTLSFWNTKADSITFGFLFNDTVIDEWSMNSVNSQHNAYNIISGQKCNAIRLTIRAAMSCDQKIQPELTDNGEYPTEFEPYGYKITPSINLYPDLSIVDTDSYSLNDWYYEDTRLTDLLAPGTYTISFVTDSITAGTTTDGTIGIGTTSDYTEDIEWFTRAAVGNMTTVTVTLAESTCLWARFVRDHSIVKITCSISVSQIRVEEGSTAYHYEQTTPIYLGVTQTTRRIKKLVLTGEEENWNVGGSGTNLRFYIILNDAFTSNQYATLVCTHFLGGIYGTAESKNGGCDINPYKNLRFNNSNIASTVDGWKTYLASEYQAGHPVTVWYVLAQESTAVVNEPLYKIGDYSDKVSSTNTGAPDIATRIGENTLTVGTTIQPSAISLTYLNGYNYYLPITLGGVQEKYYLGQVAAKRKIKRLVLDGTENWTNQPLIGITCVSTPKPTGIPVASTNLLCTAFSVTSSNAVPLYSFYVGGSWMNFNYDGVNDIQTFKSYLAAQYQAGHPVTIWYVLANETTSAVNEPLYRISTYSDSLTLSDVDISTGNDILTIDTKIPPSKTSIKLHAKKIRYGFKIDKSQENSESAVIYTHDALTMTPAVMDFTNDVFTYGSWENAWFVKDARPCVLNVDGTVAYYLDPNDATKKIDGTPSDIYYELLSTEPQDWSTQWKQYYQIVSGEYVLNEQNSAPTFATDTYYKLTYNSSFTGNFMVEFPKVWFYRHEDSQYNYIEISNYKLSDDWKCYAHINESGQEVDFIYLPMFKGVIVDSKLRSIPGVIPQGNTTASTEVTAASNLGSRWQVWDHSSVEMINDLLVLMTKSIDSQGRFGKGRESGYNSSDTVTYGKLQTGTLIKKGKFHGYSSSYKEVKVFGIEGFWANRWDRVQGLLLVNNVWKVKITPPYNFTGTDFVTLSNAEVPTGNGYLSRIQTSEYGSLPASISGGASTKFYKDYFYKTATDTRVALRGGNCYSGGYCGFRYVNVGNTASNSYWNIGASPVYK